MAVQPTALARARAYTLSPVAFARVAFATVAMLWLIVATGAAVRLTGSGLGCRHWPGCEPGHPLPARDYHAFIEFGNRLVGGVTIALTVALWIAARRTPGLQRWAVRLAFAIFLGTLAQAPLGYLAVKSDLRWPVVTAHLLLSILLLGGAVVVALEARGLREGHVEPVVARELRRLSLVFCGAGLAAIVGGSFATAAGPHSGGGAQRVDRLGTSLDVAVYAHAAVVAVFGCAFLFTLGYLAARRERSPRLFRLAVAVLALLFLQMGLGELQWRTHLPWGLVLVHVAVAAAVWAGSVALATLFHRPLASFAAEARVD
jgi:cytochrome c oxidase assembly protein subunit 15